MTGPLSLRAYHVTQARLARESYVASLTSPDAQEDWQGVKAQAREQILQALEASHYLRDVEAALCQSGSHLTVFRQLLAPPMSQDQFALLCPQYPKRNEKSGRALTLAASTAVAVAIRASLDLQLAPWLEHGGAPETQQVYSIVESIAPLLSQQSVATVRRNRLSAVQEGAVVELLRRKGWSQQSSTPIAALDGILRHHFMHKTRFATKTRPQEVDIACGLGKTVVLAMECKVTNDETNSVKRVNDVLKKASAWHAHWGSFVETAALLQGVIAMKDVERLLEARVHVFWSHDLGEFERWLDNQTAL
ncbi:MAG: hypothetical protein C0515_07430 [Novosphingobium sp.]|nr:hypothetical protein [Novosphingobium sp.]